MSDTSRLLSVSLGHLLSAVRGDFLLIHDVLKGYEKDYVPCQEDKHPHADGLFLKQVVANEHGIVVVHQKRHPMLQSRGFYLSIFMRSTGKTCAHYMQYHPTALAIAEHRVAICDGPHVGMLVFSNAGSTYYTCVPHTLDGDVTSVTFLDEKKVYIGNGSASLVATADV